MRRLSRNELYDFYLNVLITLNDSDLVSDIQCIGVGSQSDIGLLLTIGSDESVDLLNLDIIQSLHSFLDLSLVGSDINQEGEGVGLFDFLHGRFSSKRRLDNCVLIELVPAGSRFSGILWGSLQTKSLGAVEMHAGTALGGHLADRALLHGGSCILGLLQHRLRHLCTLILHRLQRLIGFHSQRTNPYGLPI